MRLAPTLLLLLLPGLVAAQAESVVTEPPEPPGPPMTDPEVRPAAQPGTVTPVLPRLSPSGAPTFDLAGAQARAEPPPRSLTDLASRPQSRRPPMIGDFFVSRAGVSFEFVPRFVAGTATRALPGPGGGPPILVVTPTLEQRFEPRPLRVPGGSRSFKIADNESPAPDDRIFLAFNTFSDFGDALNRRFGLEGSHGREYRETFGLEKTLWGGAASFGLRLPLVTVTTDIPLSGADGTYGGDLSLLFKYAPYRDDETGDVLSVGLAVTAPTGSDAANPFHRAGLQPWVGYYKSWGDWFLHGFTALDVPTDDGDAVLLFNDIGLGYYLWRSDDPAGRVAFVAPTVEVHVNTPLDHRGALHSFDPAGTPDTVDLTFGATLGLRGGSRLSFGLVVPATGPRPFDWEAVGALNLRF
jgi:hypothetical protein